MTIDELKERCPLVTIEATMEKITGRVGSTVVVQVTAANVNSGTLRKFQAAYERAYNAGLIKGAA